MNAPRYSVAAAKLIAKHLPTAPSELPARERSLETIERAMQARARRRRLFVAGSSLVAAAAAGILFTWAGFRSHVDEVSINVAASGSGAAVRTSGSARQISSQMELFAGQRLETAFNGGATLQLSTGTAVVLSGSTSFRVDNQGRSERFSLERGEMSAHVAKLVGGQRFVVGTPDAEVEVRGTRFRLSVVERPESCGGGSRTRLEVTEGVVEVRANGASERIVAGGRWPSDCASTIAPEPPRVVETPPTAAPTVTNTFAPRHAAAPHPAGSEAKAIERDTALAAQNDLFAQGVAMRRQGDASGALRAFNELIQRYPSSPLSENAMAERLRLLTARGGKEATEEAARYLARYPHGFAAEQARRVMGDE